MQPITAFPPSPVHPANTLGAVLRRRAQERPGDQPFPDSDLTYAELLRRARAVAARLGSAIAPGSRVLLAPAHGDDFAAGFYGCVLAGMVALPLPEPEGGRKEHVAYVERVVADCAPDALLTAPPLSYELGALGRTRVLVADGLHVDGVPMGELASAWRPVGVLPTAPAYLRYPPDGTASGANRDKVKETAEFTHRDVLTTLLLLAGTARLGLGADHLDWLAGVHGLEGAWRVLLPVYRGEGRRP